MKATCPTCSTSYRVADEKVPDTGAQIKCPKCDTRFVVQRPPAPEPPGHEQSTPLQALTGEPLPPPVKTPDLPAPAQKARGMSAIRAQSGPKAQTSWLQESFRVRTASGLTYDFPTREAMVRWLRERDDLAGCEAADASGNWRPASEYVRPAAPGVEAVKEPARETAPGRTAPIAAVKVGSVAIPRREASGVLWAAAGLSALLVLLAVAATLTRYGVADLSGIPPLGELGIAPPQAVSGTDSFEDGAPLVDRDAEQEYQDFMAAARRSSRSKQFSRAALEYNRALSVRPESPEALEGLAAAYQGLGDRDRAAATLKQMHSLKGD